jgi:hypothetical protein
VLPGTTAALTAQSARTRIPDRAALLDGVGTIAKPGAPAPLAVFGKGAFAVVAAKDGSGALHALVAASRTGRGRTVWFGHDGYLELRDDAADDAERATARLVRNAIHWAGARDGDERRSAGRRAARGLRVAVVGDRGRSERLARTLTDAAAGLSAEATTWSKACAGGFDVVVAREIAVYGDDRSRDSRDETIAELRAFVEKGGGFVGAGLRWGWEQLHPREDPFRDFDANLFAHTCGIAFGVGTIDEVLPVEAIDDGGLDALHARIATDSLFARTGAIDEDAVRRFAQTVVTAARSIDPGDDSFLPRLARLAGHARGAPPTEAAPLRQADGARRVAWTLADLEARRRAPENTEPMPGSEVFPGAPRGRAEPRTIEVRVDASRPGWTGTGAWAPAGTAVTVRFQRTPPTGTTLRIGCHTDRLWDKDEWRRHPEISLRVPVDGDVVRFATPYGGLVFVDVPEGDPTPLGLRIDNAVPAPRFVLGTTRDGSSWNDEKRFPGPWAELVGNDIALCVPSEHVRDLDDPSDLMTFWDQAVAMYEELDQRPVFARKERFVTDVQISAGYMHSGYPIMTHLDVAPVLVDLAAARSGEHGGVWGFWHELGHNRQLPEWTFEGTGEVTNNLFSLFVIERHQGLAPWEQPQIRGNARKIQQYLKSPDFATWRREPFTALAMYVDLQRAFGWEAFQTVFREYREADAASLPKNDDDKRDQWLVRFSRAVDRDLSPFFARWGVPVSSEAVASLRGLEPFDAAGHALRASND